MQSQLFLGEPLPTGQEIYDKLMLNIEPELVTKNLNVLDAPYKDESPASRTKRYKKYAKAFAEYRKKYKAWIQNLNRAVQTYKRAVKKAIENVSKHEEDQALRSLEAQMSAA